MTLTWQILTLRNEILTLEELLAWVKILTEEVRAKISLGLHPRQPKTKNFLLKIKAVKYITGVEVTMDNRWITLEVEKGESLGDVEDDREAAVPSEGGEGAEEGLLEAPMGHVLVDEQATVVPLKAIAEEGDNEEGGAEGGEDVELVLELVICECGTSGGGGRGGEEALHGDGLIDGEEAAKDGGGGTAVEGARGVEGGGVGAECTVGEAAEANGVGGTHCRGGEGEGGKAAVGEVEVEEKEEESEEETEMATELATARRRAWWQSAVEVEIGVGEGEERNREGIGIEERGRRRLQERTEEEAKRW